LARFSSGALAVVWALSAPPVASAQPQFHVDPVRAVFVRKVPLTLAPQDMQPCARAAGAVDCVAVRPGSVFGNMRIRVRVTPSAESGWSVRVRDGLTGVVLDAAIQIVAGQSVVWTDEIPGHGAFVELVGPGAGSQRTMAIDRVDGDVAKGTEQAIVGVNGLRVLADLPAPFQWVKDLGRSVARLRFETPLGEATCTGFLLEANVLMTNEHCINTPEKAQSLVAEFGYDVPGARVERFKGVAIVDVNASLDYSLVRLDGRPGDKWGVLTFNPTAAASGRQLVIIEHPQGGYKKVSLEHCDVDSVGKKGAGSDSTDFAHGCDTLGGSSGSPVIDLETHAVVGLHHFGFIFDDKPAINQAVDACRLPRTPACIPASR
jgi:V8-like Glu-specific endopeptidase